MSITVRIPTPLRPVTSGQAEVKIEGATVGEVLRKMDSQFQGFGERVLENDRKNVKRFINVFVNEDSIRDKKDLDTEVKPGDTISILPSIAGGSGNWKVGQSIAGDHMI
jgi:molybdopterin synthase sulfur carrier subunit